LSGSLVALSQYNRNGRISTGQNMTKTRVVRDNKMDASKDHDHDHDRDDIVRMHYNRYKARSWTWE
jgi:hypothetical protein